MLQTWKTSPSDYIKAPSPSDRRSQQHLDKLLIAKPRLCYNFIFSPQGSQALRVIPKRGFNCNPLPEKAIQILAGLDLNLDEQMNQTASSLKDSLSQPQGLNYSTQQHSKSQMRTDSATATFHNNMLDPHLQH